MEIAYGGLYAHNEGQQDIPSFSWPQKATEDIVAEDACCSRAEVKGALLACQEANFLHCYTCQHLQSAYMPEDVMIITIQSLVWMGA